MVEDGIEVSSKGIPAEVTSGVVPTDATIEVTPVDATIEATPAAPSEIVSEKDIEASQPSQP